MKKAKQTSNNNKKKEKSLWENVAKKCLKSQLFDSIVFLQRQIWIINYYIKI